MFLNKKEQGIKQLTCRGMIELTKHLNTTNGFVFLGNFSRGYIEKIHQMFQKMNIKKTKLLDLHRDLYDS